jgi:hypothetical protein
MQYLCTHFFILSFGPLQWKKEQNKRKKKGRENIMRLTLENENNFGNRTDLVFHKIRQSHGHIYKPGSLQYPRFVYYNERSICPTVQEAVMYWDNTSLPWRFILRRFSASHYGWLADNELGKHLERSGRSLIMYCVRFEAFTAMTMKNVVFWDVALCRTRVNRRFGGTFFIIRYYFSFFLEWLRKTAKPLRHNSPWPGLNSNQALPENKARALSLLGLIWPQYEEILCMKIWVSHNGTEITGFWDVTPCSLVDGY